MARGKFQTLTEQMFYILLCLRQERCGADVMAWVAEATGSRVAVGPGTLYNLLEQFLQAGYIRETKVEGRKRSYVLTPTGREALEAEARRLRQLTADYERLMESEGGAPGSTQSGSGCPCTAFWTGSGSQTIWQTWPPGAGCWTGWGPGPGTTGGQSRSSSGSPSPFSPGPGGSLPLRRRGWTPFRTTAPRPGGTGRPAPTRYRCFTARIRRPFPSTPTRRRSWRTSDGALESP